MSGKSGNVQADHEQVPGVKDGMHRQTQGRYLFHSGNREERGPHRAIPSIQFHGYTFTNDLTHQNEERMKDGLLGIVFPPNNGL